MAEKKINNVKRPAGSAAFDPDHGCGNDPTKAKAKLKDFLDKQEPKVKIPRDPKYKKQK